MLDKKGLPLFDWAEVNTASVLAFPLHRRVGKVRDVAAKLDTKTTEAHSAQYINQVTQALERQLARYCTSPEEVQKQLSKFWSQVACQTARLAQSPRGGNPRGAA